MIFARDGTVNYGQATPRFKARATLRLYYNPSTFIIIVAFQIDELNYVVAILYSAFAAEMAFQNLFICDHPMRIAILFESCESLARKQLWGVRFILTVAAAGFASIRLASRRICHKQSSRRISILTIESLSIVVSLTSSGSSSVKF